ncbi:hypothetical protein FA13DRAFT_1704873 [Coprinellus micaceus]|uniref:Uncharacterized protein n=1 Tax=Coprinellus micaceus TaxID=71717 RepID=A0A4Y7TU51_COPMI|nr:hypothetical protein FA13DRAFT_1704873 [Coprinellus micaceus]
MSNLSRRKSSIWLRIKTRGRRGIVAPRPPELDANYQGEERTHEISLVCERRRIPADKERVLVVTKDDTGSLRIQDSEQEGIVGDSTQYRPGGDEQATSSARRQSSSQSSSSIEIWAVAEEQRGRRIGASDSVWSRKKKKRRGEDKAPELAIEYVYDVTIPNRVRKPLFHFVLPTRAQGGWRCEGICLRYRVVYSVCLASTKLWASEGRWTIRLQPSTYSLKFMPHGSESCPLHCVTYIPIAFIDSPRQQYNITKRTSAPADLTSAAQMHGGTQRALPLYTIRAQANLRPPRETLILNLHSPIRHRTRKVACYLDNNDSGHTPFPPAYPFSDSEIETLNRCTLDGDIHTPPSNQRTTGPPSTTPETSPLLHRRNGDRPEPTSELGTSPVSTLRRNRDDVTASEAGGVAEWDTTSGAGAWQTGHRTRVRRPPVDGRKNTNNERNARLPQSGRTRPGRKVAETGSHNHSDPVSKVPAQGWLELEHCTSGRTAGFTSSLEGRRERMKRAGSLERRVDDGAGGYARVGPGELQKRGKSVINATRGEPKAERKEERGAGRGRERHKREGEKDARRIRTKMKGKEKTRTEEVEEIERTGIDARVPTAGAGRNEGGGTSEPEAGRPKARSEASPVDEDMEQKGGRSGEVEEEWRRLDRYSTPAPKHRRPSTARHDAGKRTRGCREGERLKSKRRAKNSLGPNLVISQYRIRQDPRQLPGDLVRYDGLHPVFTPPPTSSAYLGTALLTWWVSNRRRRFSYTVRMYASTLEHVDLRCPSFIRPGYGMLRAGRSEREPAGSMRTMRRRGADDGAMEEKRVISTMQANSPTDVIAATASFSPRLSPYFRPPLRELRGNVRRSVQRDGSGIALLNTRLQDMWSVSILLREW